MILNNTTNITSQSQPFIYQKEWAPLTERDNDELFASLFNDDNHKGKIGGFHFRRIFNNLAIAYVKEYFHPMTRTTSHLISIKDMKKNFSQGNIKNYTISRLETPLLQVGFISLDDDNEYYTITRKNQEMYCTGETCGAIISIMTYMKILIDYESVFSTSMMYELNKQKDLLITKFINPLNANEKSFLKTHFNI